jgi:hypothetical protein
METNKCNERSKNIQIKKNLSTPNKINSPKSEYSMNQNLFDPSKSSPPNDFMKKLEKRINIYSNINIHINNNNYLDNMVVSLDNE